jgi:hypothetical protein
VNRLAAGDVDGLQAFYHDRFIGWPAQAPEPVDPETGRAFLDELLASTRIVSARLEPEAARVSDSVAIVHYLAIFDLQSDGEALRSTFRITHTWIETPAGWKILGGMSSPHEPVNELSSGG